MKLDISYALVYVQPQQANFSEGIMLVPPWLDDFWRQKRGTFEETLPWVFLAIGDSSLSSIGGDLFNPDSCLERLSSLSTSDLTSSSLSFSSESELLLNWEFEFELEGERGMEEFLCVNACCFMLPWTVERKKMKKVVSDRLKSFFSYFYKMYELRESKRCCSCSRRMLKACKEKSFNGIFKILFLQKSRKKMWKRCNRMID